MVKTEYADLPALLQHKLILQDFWLEHGRPGGINKYKSYGRKGYKKTIQALIDIGEVILYYNSSHDRKMFEQKKLTVKKFNGFTKCFACRGRAQVRHHIIWLSRGGRNQKNNIIGLCRACHAEIHPWLK